MFWLLWACRSDAVIEGTPPVSDEPSVPSEYVPPESNASYEQELGL